MLVIHEDILTQVMVVHFLLFCVNIFWLIFFAFMFGSEWREGWRAWWSRRQQPGSAATPPADTRGRQRTWWTRR